MKPGKSTFGGLLRRFRTGTRLSQADVAARARISPSLVALLETGRRHPSAKTAVALARALSLTPAERSELLRHAGYASEEPAPVGALTTLLDEVLGDSRLTPRQKVKAESLIRAFALWVRDGVVDGKLKL